MKKVSFFQIPPIVMVFMLSACILDSDRTYESIARSRVQRVDNTHILYHKKVSQKHCMTDCMDSEHQTLSSQWLIRNLETGNEKSVPGFVWHDGDSYYIMPYRFITRAGSNTLVRVHLITEEKDTLPNITKIETSFMLSEDQRYLLKYDYAGQTINMALCNYETGDTLFTTSELGRPMYIDSENGLLYGVNDVDYVLGIYYTYTYNILTGEITETAIEGEDFDSIDLGNGQTLYVYKTEGEFRTFPVLNHVNYPQFVESLSQFERYTQFEIILNTGMYIQNEGGTYYFGHFYSSTQKTLFEHYERRQK